MLDKLARFMGVKDMQVKPCISCGKECQLEEAISAYLEFPSVDDYVTAFDLDMDDDNLWWMHAYIPMQQRYVDVYALHVECMYEEVAYNPAHVSVDNPDTLWSLTRGPTCANCGTYDEHLNEDGLCNECRAK